MCETIGSARRIGYFGGRNATRCQHLARLEMSRDLLPGSTGEPHLVARETRQLVVDVRRVRLDRQDSR
jgi:hypothetical protein